MKRRSLLTAFGSVLLTGCTSSGIGMPPGTAPPPTATPTPTGFERDLQASLERDDRDINLDVVYVSQDGNAAVLEYRAGAPHREVIAKEIATVAAVYAVLVTDGYEIEILEVTIRNIAGTAIGFYHIESEWVRQLQRGEITTEEYLRLVLETVEAKE